MYAKLFSSIYQGTLRGDTQGLVVFTNLLAHADSQGWVDIHPRAIADEVGLTLAQVSETLLMLESPDPESRSPEEEGRRIVRLDDHRAWGWRIVNHAKYRAIKSEEDRRESNRLAQQRWREKNKQAVSTPNNASDQSAQAEAEAEAEAEALNTVPTALVASATPNRLSCPTGELVSLYHQHLPMLPRVEILNDTRRRRIAARWREVISDPEIAKSDDPKSAALAWFAWFFEHAAQSPFLTGKSKDWRASFDFLIAPTNFAKVAEGNYHRTAA